ncbi:unnamed protein product [Thlaspi arvense]|uniref:Uncharacterized protein n=1 Tax=Thlaspi arvense TaxID=13288 RepID=A0AAU9T0R4_THLAR|nr:unnamed protein product [Thlaspi arvense]
MAKVHPKGGKNPSLETGSEASVLTVWKKSLMFSCNGFAVFDSNGDLVFRVDNYMHGNRGQILLMDASGKPLLTIRPQDAEPWRLLGGVRGRDSVEAAVNGEKAPQQTEIEDTGLRHQHLFKKEDIPHPRIILPAMLRGVRR